VTTENGTDKAPQGSAQGLLEFLTWAAEKHEIVDTTASALRTGCQKVLSVEDDLLGLDLRTADIDKIVERFRVSSRMKMKDRTVDQYEQRFRQSVDMYTRYLNGDPDWKPSARARSNSSTNKSNGKRTTTAKPSGADSKPSNRVIDGDVRVVDVSGLISYPFPLRPGLTVRLLLPADLTAREASRLSAFIAALSVDDPQGSPFGEKSS